MMRDFRRFLAAMALALVAVGLFAMILNQPDPNQILIDPGVSAAPAVWPDLAGATPTPSAQAPRLAAVPADPIGRAKFPGEDTRQVDQLAFINLTVNQVILYTPDAAHYADDQQMISWPADLKGDCEDIALSKLVSLVRAGWPVVEAARLRFAYLRPSPGAERVGHIVVEVRLAKGAIAILDNNFDQLMTRRELEARGYRFFDW